jgi:hypothetical protein
MRLNHFTSRLFVETILPMCCLTVGSVDSNYVYESFEDAWHESTTY